MSKKPARTYPELVEQLAFRLKGDKSISEYSIKKVMEILAGIVYEDVITDVEYPDTAMMALFDKGREDYNNPKH